jgi:hypothetical protein
MNKRQSKKQAGKKKKKAGSTGLPMPKPWGSVWLPSKDWPSQLSFSVDYLSELHDIVVSQTSLVMKRLEERWNELPHLHLPPDDEYEARDILVDDAHVANSVRRWSTLLQVVALFHQLESELQMLFRWVLSGLPKQDREPKLRSIHQWKELRKLYKECCDRELTKVSRYNEVNELRLLCNSVKHAGGKVTHELAEFTKSTTKLQQGADLEAHNIDLPKYRAALSEFLEDFAAEAEAGLQQKFGKPAKSPTLP